VITVQAQIEIQGDISLANISQEIEKINLPKEILKTTIIKLQDDLLLELCGKKYQRNPHKQFTRAGNTKRTLSTRHGKIEFKLAKIHSQESNSILRPLLLYIGIESKKRHVNDLSLECAELATYLTYRDSKTVLENLTHAKVSKDQIHACAQEVGDFMNQTRRKSSVAEKDVDLIMGDGTKAHGYGGKKNEISVLLGKNEAGEKELLGLSVNESWKDTGLQFKGKAKVAVSDNESGLRRVLLEKSDDYQACVLHCIRDVKVYLWQAGLPKEQRKTISERVESVLWTLCNSVNVHVADGDFKRLRWRVDFTLEELKRISGEFLGAGLESVARFIRNAANHMVTFARLALNGVSIPFSNNLVGRLMGEIAKRVKHKWMHWSARGFENLLNILLARYCNKHFYNEMKEKYLSPNRTIIKMTIT
jgi:hypothetical protein